MERSRSRMILSIFIRIRRQPYTEETRSVFEVSMAGEKEKDYLDSLRQEETIFKDYISC